MCIDESESDEKSLRPRINPSIKAQKVHNNFTKECVPTSPVLSARKLDPISLLFERNLGECKEAKRQEKIITFQGQKPSILFDKQVSRQKSQRS